jgi:hypothetical protein
MAARQSNGRIASDKSRLPDILQFTEAGLAVQSRPDIEIAVRSDGEADWCVVLAPAQAVATAQRLLAAALAVAAGAEVEP